MRYLIIPPDSAPFFTEWYSEENFVPGMVVIRTTDRQYTRDGKTWLEIEVDHL